MKTLNFIISKDEKGVYCADCTNAFIVTDGETLDEVVQNIKEASELFFEEGSASDIKSPYFTITFSDKVYA
jgi:predicted RNase H-like HicB family nuclease